MLEDNNIKIDVSLQQSISSNLANHFKIIPKSISNQEYVFYHDDSTGNSKQTKNELRQVLNRHIQLIPAKPGIINKALAIYYRNYSNTTKAKSNDFLESLIFEAQAVNASDIHIEVFEDDARVRLRIDGLLIEKNKIKKENYLELINQIKIKSKLDITEKRLPQDGRIEYEDFDMRVSILPTHYGEKVVMRILGRNAEQLNINELGFQATELKLYLESVKKTNGIVLISGPTGSGKTTTLYATLKMLNDIKRNIVTVEDPIEYTLKGINQVQLKESIGLTFTSALRSFLRQDPDIIMLGEIRDGKTAQMAIRASLTGHLVLSTIHTNSSVGTISRLLDMDVPGFLIAETINLSVAQRLIRLLCKQCKVKQLLEKEDFPRDYNIPKPVKYQFIAQGCEHCHYTGYKGRKAIYEVLPITDEVAKAIKINALEQYNFIKGATLSNKAFDLFYNGETSLDEIYPILIHS